MRWPTKATEERNKGGAERFEKKKRNRALETQAPDLTLASKPERGDSNQYSNLQLVLASFNEAALFCNYPFVAFSIFINAEIRLDRGGELHPKTEVHG